MGCSPGIASTGGRMKAWMCRAAMVFGLLPIWPHANAWGAEALDAAVNVPGSEISGSAGRSATQLPDGRWLVLGGAQAGQVSADARLVNARTGESTALPISMRFPRSGHTATLLPDGTVLILGGITAGGATVDEAERFNPATQQFETLGSLGQIPRSGHTATVLTDGRLLIIGGADARGEPLAQAELLDLSTMRVQSFNALLDTAQMNHIATLLPSSDVLVAGGIDGRGHAVPGGELFESATQRFNRIDSQAVQQLVAPLSSAAPPALVDTSPQADARDVATSQPLVVRLSKPMDVATLNEQTVTLLGPNGAAQIKPVAVEGGLLLFVTPAQELLPASRYTLFVRGATDAQGQPLPFVAIGFNTAAAGGAASNASTSAAGASTAGASTSPSASSTAAAAEQALARAEVAAKAAAAAAPVDDEDWIPGLQHRKGNWASGRWVLAKQSPPNRASLRKLLHDRITASPPQSFGVLKAAMDARAAESLQVAATGMTALAGQVLRLNGRPLANVTVQMGAVTARTDAQGEFLLANIPAGNQVLTVDGESANRANARYGRFAFNTNIVAGQTNDLDHIVWMPKLDMRHAVDIASPTVSETVITNPNLPGLELVLPPGTVIRDAHGKLVTQVTITPIPVDQTPFPMPFFDVPIYFTLQPGGSVIQGIDGKPAAALLRYPNYGAMGPGHLVRLFDHDLRGRGWYYYGDGKVSSDGQRIVSGRDFLIYQFTATSFSNGGVAPDGNTPSGDKPDGDDCSGGGDAGCPGTRTAGEPVDLFTGYLKNVETDLVVRDIVPLAIRRTYRTLDKSGAADIVRPFGIGSSHASEMFLQSEPNFAALNLVLNDGTRIRFANVNPAGMSYNSDFVNTDSPGEFYQAVLHYYLDPVKGGCFYTLYFRDGRRWAFGAIPARLLYMEDRNGNRVTFVRSGGSYVTQILGPTGRYINLAYNASGQISQATDNTGRTVTYGYDTGQRLTTVTKPDGKIRTYLWDTTNNRITAVKDERNNTTVTHQYDANGRVFKQTLADQSTFTFAYTLVNGVATKTEVTDRRGSIRRAEFDPIGRIVKDTFPAGIVGQEQVTTFTRNAVNGRVDAIVDARNRRTELVYDALGNVTKITKLVGSTSPPPAVTELTYDTAFSNPLTYKDPNLNTTTLGYDASGNLTSVKNPLNETTVLTYDAQGRVLTVKNGLNVTTTTLTYSGADLASIADALGRTTVFNYDALGRLTGVRDPMGRITTRTYDVQDRLTKLTDALGGAIQLTYDEFGNLKTYADPKNQATNYQYDSLNRLSTRTDALLQAETYAYELGGRLSRVTDRKGQVSGASYDALGRLAQRGFGATTAAPTSYTSTIGYTWDTGNRLTGVNDSANGNITRTYDELDRLTQEVTVQGTVNYTYDAAGRRTTLQVAGQPLITYTWDVANRLKQIQQAGGPINNNIVQSVDFTYDAAGRRTRTKYSNAATPKGVTIDYGYDNADQVTSLTYKKLDGQLLGDVTYAYDAAGRRVTPGGSLSVVRLPAAASATYDANNRLSSWNGTALSYDNNGNLIGDSSIGYTWNARNQLVSMSGAVNASFTYDGLGRRIGKTVGGVPAGYVYDGLNLVQEKNGTSATSTPTANFVTGLGLDETFLRMTGSGADATVLGVLADGNNNTLHLTNRAGSVVDSYSYQAYGIATHYGAGEPNTQQYTGRENDETGLYYYRARYYHPTFGRFISEDPIEFGAGPNVYAYVGGDPINSIDPSGLAEAPPGPGSKPPPKIVNWPSADRGHFGAEIPGRPDQMWNLGGPEDGRQGYNPLAREKEPPKEPPKISPEPQKEPIPFPPAWARWLGPIGVGIWAMCRSGNAY